ncbi:BQ2448_2246 [Microbotryum intermedium]|uniref:BQ2448_2246 protein n=1 Tax=Microbotryum intermedium TaxID=269621 RepID=A0A238FDQ7_9BASI|nr:BQ2448_2246 [Microbotryum intermedium]
MGWAHLYEQGHIRRVVASSNNPGFFPERLVIVASLDANLYDETLRVAAHRPVFDVLSSSAPPVPGPSGPHCPSVRHGFLTLHVGFESSTDFFIEPEALLKLQQSVRPSMRELQRAVRPIPLGLELDIGIVGDAKFEVPDLRLETAWNSVRRVPVGHGRISKPHAGRKEMIDVIVAALAQQVSEEGHDSQRD